MLAEANVELYAGNGAHAYELVVRDWRTLERSFLLRVQYVRADASFLRARAALASATACADPRSRIAEAARLARQLQGEGMPWTAALAAMIAAGVAHAMGDRGETLAQLRAAVERSEAAGMQLHAMAARYRLGSLLGDDGRALQREASDAMSAEGIRLPAQMTGMLIPGACSALDMLS